MDGLVCLLCLFVFGVGSCIRYMCIYMISGI